MKIAIVGYFKYHLECIGFLLENYNNVDIYLGKDTDTYNWIDYYSTIFNFNVIYDGFHKDIIYNYDKIFKLTSNDSCLDHKKIISILHLNGKQQLVCSSEKFISLTPYIHGESIHYIFPIYRPILSVSSKVSNTVTMIGYYRNSDFDMDTIKFINDNINYNFIFIIWGSRCYPRLRNLKNVKLISEIKTNNMIEIIHESKFILSKKNIWYDRFSGQLALAMSYEKPMMIDIITKDTYNLPGIAFDTNYSEIGYLDDITDEEYKLLKNEIHFFKETIIDRNKSRFQTL